MGPSWTLFEELIYMKGYQVIAGIDEVGRGPLAGPVVAAACIFPRGYTIDGINDSKQLTEEERNKLFAILTRDPKIIYGIGIKDHKVIDEINILQASLRAMLQAVENLKTQPDYLLIDGNQLPLTEIPKLGIIQGDRKSLSIAAASIIAKVTRDRLMLEYHEKWPKYGFDTHKGYATEKHRKAIEDHGPCPIHRLTFSPFSIHQPDFFKPNLLNP